jgi:hypothetical protein
VRKVADDVIELFALADPASEFSPEQGAGLLQSACSLRITLNGHRMFHFEERVLTGCGHAPGEERPAARVRPGVVGRGIDVVRCRGSHGWTSIP